jgi:hypothetical protein
MRRALQSLSGISRYLRSSARISVRTEAFAKARYLWEAPLFDKALQTYPNYDEAHYNGVWLTCGWGAMKRRVNHSKGY